MSKINFIQTQRERHFGADGYRGRIEERDWGGRGLYAGEAVGRLLVKFRTNDKTLTN